MYGQRHAYVKTREKCELQKWRYEENESSDGKILIILNKNN